MKLGSSIETSLFDLFLEACLRWRRWRLVGGGLEGTERGGGGSGAVRGVSK